MSFRAKSRNLFLAACTCLLLPTAVLGSHHGWKPIEAFSNADGTLQFVEMQTSGGTETDLDCCGPVEASNLSNTSEFNTAAMTDLTGSTSGKSVLLATAAFEAAYGIKPDFYIDENFLFIGPGDVWYNQALTWSSGLPTDGWQSYNTGGVIQAATPKNFAGETLTLSEPEPEPTFTLARQYLMTTSNSANISTLHVVNQEDTSQSFTGTLYNGSGTQQGDADVALSSAAVPAKGRLKLSASDLETLFGVSAWSGPAVLEVKGTGAFSLMSKLISPSGLVSNTNCVRETRVLNIEEPSSADRTYVRFINTGDETISDIRGTLYDASGNVVGTADTQLLATLNPRQQTWLNRNHFQSLFGDWSGEAMLEVGDAENLKLLNLNFVNDETFFNFSCFESSETSGDVYLMTTSTSANISNLHIVNTSQTGQTFSGTLYNKDGQQLGATGTYLGNPVPSKGRLIMTANDIEQVFGVSAWSGPAILRVTGTSDFELMIKLESPSGLISNTNCVRQNEVHNIEGFDSQDQTYVRFINIGTSTISQITGTLYDSNGAVIGAADSVLVSNLGAKQAVWKTRNHLSDIVGDTWNGEAFLKVSSHDDLRLLNLNFPNSETFFNFSCYEESN